MVHYFEFIKQKDKRYVSWNILFLWGFGLWIALCTTTLFSEENWNSGLAYNIVSETETTTNLMNVKATNYTLCSTSLPLNAVVRLIGFPQSTEYLYKTCYQRSD
ncbi:uncharacterized protein LOC143356529 isoform X2 [Halictus rubicundus]|uniref:uncharacterized protein LOC143356529 isoform X2 n=1 Tax=Halictus rubicundus TaxID=77578 RepID=UPI004036314D